MWDPSSPLHVIYQWIWTLITTTTIYNDVANQIEQLQVTQPNVYGFIDCMAATAQLLIPLQSIAIYISIKLPLMFVSFILAVIYRVKSFIPTMGH